MHDTASLHEHEHESPTSAAAEPIEAQPAVEQHPRGAVPGLVRRLSHGDDPLGGQPIPEPALAALRRRRGGGDPLPEGVAGSMGNALQTDLSGVRVHTDGEAQDLAKGLQAKAFTYGNDVYFGSGTYQPNSQDGQRTLAHELAHVAQQRSGADRGGPVVGRADDPAEAAADRTADSALTALRRQASRTDAVSPTKVRPLPGETVQRIPKFLKTIAARLGVHKPNPKAPVTTNAKPQDAPAPAPAQTQAATTSAPQVAPTPESATVAEGVVDAEETGKTSPVDVFVAALKPPSAPPSKAEGQKRMQALRVVITAMTPQERAEIAKNTDALDKAQTFLGDVAFLALMPALDAYTKATKKKSDGSTEQVKHHLTGAEADKFIADNMDAVPHIAPFLQAAKDAGKKGEGMIATVDGAMWNKLYEIQNPGETAGVDDLKTNAYVANRNPDRPAILHADRGTPSTAIHESMHQYTMNRNVLNEFGPPLNEGLTEFFTRMFTNQNAQPAKNGGPERTNYQANITFVRNIKKFMGANETAQETALAEVYFNGNTAKLKAAFVEAWKNAATPKQGAEVETAWTTLKEKLDSKNWAEALAQWPAATT